MQSNGQISKHNVWTRFVRHVEFKDKKKPCSACGGWWFTALHQTKQRKCMECKSISKLEYTDIL